MGDVTCMRECAHSTSGGMECDVLANNTIRLWFGSRWSCNMAVTSFLLSNGGETT